MLFTTQDNQFKFVPLNELSTEDVSLLTPLDIDSDLNEIGINGYSIIEWVVQQCISSEENFDAYLGVLIAARESGLVSPQTWERARELILIENVDNGLSNEVLSIIPLEEEDREENTDIDDSDSQSQSRESEHIPLLNGEELEQEDDILPPPPLRRFNTENPIKYGSFWNNKDETSNTSILKSIPGQKTETNTETEYTPSLFQPKSRELAGYTRTYEKAKNGALVVIERMNGVLMQ